MSLLLRRAILQAITVEFALSDSVANYQLGTGLYNGRGIAWDGSNWWSMGFDGNARRMSSTFVDQSFAINTGLGDATGNHFNQSTNKFYSIQTTGNDKIIIFNSSFVETSRFDATALNGNTDISQDDSGNLYVTANTSIYKYSSSGVPISNNNPLLLGAMLGIAGYSDGLIVIDSNEVVAFVNTDMVTVNVMGDISTDMTDPQGAFVVGDKLFVLSSGQQRVYEYDII